MPWNGSGTFSRKVTTVSPATADTTIDASAQNAYTADVIAGINAALAKNGENAATGNLSLGGYKYTNSADGLNDDDLATVGQAANSITYCSNANGNPNVSDSLLDAATNVADSTWTSIGPTSPGTATYVWSALDNVPTTADWIECNFAYYDHKNAAGTEKSITVHVRSGDGVQSAGTDNRVGYCYINALSGQVGGFGAQTTGVKIPINSDQEFDIYWTPGTGDPDALAVLLVTLTGYGTNA